MGAEFSQQPVLEKHTEKDQNDTFTAAVSTCQGWRYTQEDDHSLILSLPGPHKASFFAVFDGHGSARVSKHASEGLWRHLVENDAYIKGDFKTALEQSFLSFDREVYQSYNALLAGTTATCCLIVDNVIYCANIGDSRSVVSIDCHCKDLSDDHKPNAPHEMDRILAAGGYVISGRVNGNLALSRAFGDFHYKTNEELPADKQIVSCFPDITRIELNDDVDFIVLACDGIWDVHKSVEVVEFVIRGIEYEMAPEEICEELINCSVAVELDSAFGSDNMTVMLVFYLRGRTYSEFCTDVFNKNTRRLGLTHRDRDITDVPFRSKTDRAAGNASTSTSKEVPETPQSQSTSDEFWVKKQEDEFNKSQIALKWILEKLGDKDNDEVTTTQTSTSDSPSSDKEAEDRKTSDETPTNHSAESERSEDLLTSETAAEENNSPETSSLDDQTTSHDSAQITDEKNDQVSSGTTIVELDVPDDENNDDSKGADADENQTFDENVMPSEQETEAEQDLNAIEQKVVELELSAPPDEGQEEGESCEKEDELNCSEEAPDDDEPAQNDDNTATDENNSEDGA